MLETMLQKASWTAFSVYAEESIIRLELKQVKVISFVIFIHHT
jgi:hypothetical protein